MCCALNVLHIRNSNIKKPLFLRAAFLPHPIDSRNTIFCVLVMGKIKTDEQPNWSAAGIYNREIYSLSLCVYIEISTFSTHFGSNVIKVHIGFLLAAIDIYTRQARIN